ncbi:ABC transporter permease [Mesorhizobium sp. 1B3]|uniref:ABC transporter permease n=1 Tax=Mesorhizobium sp. 1B3 TaxID=3243599 RepID=UPI003D96885C
MSASLDAQAESTQRRRYLLLLTAPVLVLLVLFVYPVMGLLTYADRQGSALSNMAIVLTEPLYLTVFWLTIKTAIYTTILCVAFGYPLAYVAINLSPKLQSIVVALVILPFFVSLIVRTYAWMVLLGRKGLVNSGLQALSLGEESTQLLYTQTGALIGMTYALLPFVVLTCYSVMNSIDQRYMQAAYSLGASPMQVFLRVFLPLSMPGVLGGSILVFIMSLGFFITPRLMGGPSDLMVAMLIQHEVEMTLNWPLAAALSLFLLLVTIVGFIAYARLVKLESMFEGSR